MAAVFASLNEEDHSSPQADKKLNLDEVIMNAKTVNGLLTIAETQPDISRKHALKVSSTRCRSTHRLLTFLRSFPSSPSGVPSIGPS